jgi:iron complex outermembrane receptor protein
MKAWLAATVLFFLAAGGALMAQEPAEAPSTAQPQQAESDDDEGRDELEEALMKQAEVPDTFTESVKVTVQRVETELMKTPLAVTVIDQESLDREGVKSVQDIAQMVPNMDIATKNGQSTPIISLRGIRSTNETELGDPSVGVHMDGIYSPRMQGILALMFDNERVEITRGPQGTLFGRNSTVGSINIVTAKPDLKKFDARVNLQSGNYAAQELNGMVNVPVSETFGLRFAGRYHKRDSYLTGYWDPNQWDQRYIGDLVADAPVVGTGPDCSGPDCHTRTQHSNWWANDSEDNLIRALVPASNDNFYMNAKEWGYRASALWQPKYKPMSLNLSFQHYRGDGAGGIDLVNCEKLRGRPNYCRDANLDGVCDVAEDGVEEIDLENYIVHPTQPTSDCNNLFPADDTYQAAVNVPGSLYLDIKYLRTQYNYDINDNLTFIHHFGMEDQNRESAQDMEQSLNAWDQAMYFLPGTGSRSWMNEFQLQSFKNLNFNWIAGVNFFHEKTSTFGYFDNPISPKDRWVQPDRSTQAGAAFAQGTYSYSPKWHLTIGYRHSIERRKDVGGITYRCEAGDGCLLAFDRDDYNTLPTNFFANTAVYDEIFNNDNNGSWSHNDWRVGLDWDKDENTLYYGYLATGFKAGGIGDVINALNYIKNPNAGPFDPAFIPDGEISIPTSYGPEEVTTLEFGIKKKFPKAKFSLAANYFFSDYENMQYAAVGTLGFVQEPGPIFDPVTGDPLGVGLVDKPIIAYFTENVPGAEIQGIETEFDWVPWNGGRIRGYATWLDTEITEDWVVDWGYDPVFLLGLSFETVSESADPVLEANLKGNDLAVSPPIKLHATIDHAFFLEGMNATIVPWFTAHWEADSYLTIWNVDKHADDMEFVVDAADLHYTDDKREAWSMFHAGIRLHTGAWTAELYGYNLTDEVIQWWGGAAENVPKGSMSMPFNYGFRVGYQF